MTFVGGLLAAAAVVVEEGCRAFVVVVVGTCPLYWSNQTDAAAWC